jgi:hypothetical protein
VRYWVAFEVELLRQALSDRQSISLLTQWSMRSVKDGPF